jgi:hypothetical protein
MYYRTDIGDRWVEDSDKLHNYRDISANHRLATLLTY